MAGGPWGLSGSISSPSYPGQEKSYEFSYTIPATYKTNQMNIIGLLQMYDNDPLKRTVLNSTQRRFTTALTLGIDEVNKRDNMRMYPNPATDWVTILATRISDRMRGELRDASGRLIRVLDINKERTEVNISQLASGTYILNVFTADGNRSFELVKK
jgi:hypothetical protein